MTATADNKLDALHQNLTRLMLPQGSGLSALGASFWRASTPLIDQDPNWTAPDNVTKAGTHAIELGLADPIDGQSQAKYLEMRRHMVDVPFLDSPGYEGSSAAVTRRLKFAFDTGTLQEKSVALHQLERVQQDNFARANKWADANQRRYGG